MSWTITITTTFTRTISITRRSTNSSTPTASPTTTAMAAGDTEAIEDLCEAIDKFMK